ncbi:hypothetical protein P152DRAFT_414181, partial [Eremomyces bilateralis CBS 781.70]
MARPRSGTPPERINPHSPPQLSKLDKRRKQIADKIEDMNTAFGVHLRFHYEAQQLALHVDMNMVLKAKPYDGPLDDSPDTIKKLIAEELGSHEFTMDDAQRDFDAEAGRFYQAYVRTVNDHYSARDSDLSMLATRYQRDVTTIEDRAAFLVATAEEEHKILSRTVRERLINQLNARKARLVREKDQLDIADTNAQQLHPIQFSLGDLNNPGATQHPRKTRHARHKAMDRDREELLGAPTGQDNTRKRKAAFEDDNDTPTPGAIGTDLSGGSGFESKRQRTTDKTEHPVHSVNRLFTEKELSLATNKAAQAAQIHLHRLRRQTSGMQANGAPNGVNSTHPGNGDDGATPAIGDEIDDNDTPGAPEMERNISQTHHATRGAVRNERFANFRLVPATRIMYRTIYESRGRIEAKQKPEVIPLTEEEVEDDLHRIVEMGDPGEEGLNSLLDASLGPVNALGDE